MSFSDFCDDLLLEIFSHFDLEQQAEARLVCHRWNRLISYVKHRQTIALRTALAPMPQLSASSATFCDCSNTHQASKRHSIHILNATQLHHYRNKLFPLLANVRCLQLNVNNSLDSYWLQQLRLKTLLPTVQHLQIFATEFDESMHELLLHCGKSLQRLHLFFESCVYSIETIICRLLQQNANLHHFHMETLDFGKKPFPVSQFNLLKNPCFPKLTTLHLLTHQIEFDSFSKYDAYRPTSVNASDKVISTLIKAPNLRSIWLNTFDGQDLPMLVTQFDRLRHLKIDDLRLTTIEQLLSLKRLIRLQSCELNGESLTKFTVYQVHQLLRSLHFSLPTCRFVWSRIDVLTCDSMNASLWPSVCPGLAHQACSLHQALSWSLATQTQALEKLKLQSMHARTVLSLSASIRVQLNQVRQLRTLTAHLSHLRSLHLELNFCSAPLHLLSSCRQLHTLHIHGKCCTVGCPIDVQMQKLLPDLQYRLNSLSLTGSIRMQHSSTLVAIGKCNQITFLDLQPCSNPKSLNDEDDTCVLSDSVLNAWTSFDRLGFLFLNQIPFSLHSSRLIAMLSNELVWPELRFLSIQNTGLDKHHLVSITRAMRQRAVRVGAPVQLEIELESSEVTLFDETQSVNELSEQLQLHCI